MSGLTKIEAKKFLRPLEALLSDIKCITAQTAENTAGGLGISDAPSDGNKYVRQDASWALLDAGTTILTAYKTADETKVNDVALAPDADLTIPVGVGVYNVKIVLLYTADAVPDFKFTVSVPGAGSYFEGANFMYGVNIPIAENSLFILAGSGNERIAFVHGIVVANEAGNVVVNWAQNTSSANATTLHAASHIMLVKLD